MAGYNTVKTYALNDAQRVFDITFDYLARSHVIATIIKQDGSRQELSLGTDFAFVSATQIETTVAWGIAQNAVSIELKRVTPATTNVVTFQDGSILRSADLNLANLQAIYVAEEARELANEGIAANTEGNLDARNRRIVNVAPGTGARDVVVKEQLDALASTGSGFVTQSQASATEARTYAASANSSANTAHSSELEAQQAAKNAAASVTSAAQAARDADTSAKAAKASADSVGASAAAAAKAVTDSAASAKAAADSAKASATNAAGIIDSVDKSKASAAAASLSESNAAGSASAAAASAAAAARSAQEAADSAASIVGDVAKATAQATAAQTSNTLANQAQVAAETAKTDAITAKNASEAAKTAATNYSLAAGTSAASAKSEADRAKSEADKVAAQNELTNAINSVDATSHKVDFKAMPTVGGVSIDQAFSVGGLQVNSDLVCPADGNIDDETYAGKTFIVTKSATNGAPLDLEYDHAVVVDTYATWNPLNLNVSKQRIQQIYDKNSIWIRGYHVEMAHWSEWKRNNIQPYTDVGGIDLNTVTIDGGYYYNKTHPAINIPQVDGDEVSEVCFLTVSSDNSEDQVVQTVRSPKTNTEFVRYRVDGTWSRWWNSTATLDVDTAPAGFDYNTEINPGYWGVDNSTALHAPTVSVGNKVIVQILGTADGAAVQLVTDPNNGHIIMRGKVANGPWSPWGNVYSSYNKPTLADLGGVGSSNMNSSQNLNSVVATGFYTQTANHVTSNLNYPDDALGKSVFMVVSKIGSSAISFQNLFATGDNKLLNFTRYTTNGGTAWTDWTAAGGGAGTVGATALAPTQNLNTVTTTGVYTQVGANVSYANGYPGDMAGRDVSVLVTAISGSQTILQSLTAAGDAVTFKMAQWVRYSENGGTTWHVWKSASAAQATDVLSSSIILGPTEDLNTYVNPGLFVQQEQQGALNGAHYPANYSGNLQVYRSGYGVMQIYTTITNRMFIRTKNNTTWNAWVEQFNTANPPTGDHLDAYTKTESDAKFATKDDFAVVNTDIMTLTNGKVDNTRTINGHALSANIVLTAGDLGITPKTPETAMPLASTLALRDAAGKCEFVDVHITSDERLKTNIEKIDGALDKIEQMNGYTYDKALVIGGEPVAREAGIIAQELESVLSVAVSDSDGIKTVSHSGVIALLVEAVKELSERVKKLEGGE